MSGRYGPCPCAALGVSPIVDKVERTRMAYREYKVLEVSEGALGTLFLGASGMPLKKLETTLNEQASDGWQLVFQVVERRRFWLFWSRESVIITLAR